MAVTTPMPARSGFTALHHVVLDALTTAVTDGDGAVLSTLVDRSPLDHRDSLLTLLAIHDLSLAPIGQLSGTEQWQHHPAVAALRSDLERGFLDRLDRLDRSQAWGLDGLEAAAAMRRLAHADAVPPVYDWVAERAGLDDLRWYLALEGGPDGGFDDLVALSQVGITGRPKVELARNYWDEMGRGRLADVHTELHRNLVEALDLPTFERSELPIEALERSVLGGLVALSRHLQPEAIGAFGLLELQAGPRCRRVLAGLERLGAVPRAFTFYAEHADADPRHGKDWLDHVITPLAVEPRWAAGIVRGARWRSLVNRRFFEMSHGMFAGASSAMGRG